MTGRMHLHKTAVFGTSYSSQHTFRMAAISALKAIQAALYLPSTQLYEYW